MSSDEKDLYRDTPVRLLGYVNEVGESFRPIIGSKMVQLSYVIATLYVMADTGDKTIKSWKKNKNQSGRVAKTLYTTTDAFIWQMLASVFIPGYTINRVCIGTDYILKKAKKIQTTHRNLIVIGIGLMTIPFIIKPIDDLVDNILDHSLRKIRWD